MTSAKRAIGFLLYEELTLLDLVGPYELLARLPETDTRLVSKHRQPVTTDLGVLITPHLDFRTCPRLDVIVVPGGPGQEAVMDDEATLSFLRDQAQHASLVVSVCTGSLILGAAGLLDGYRATTHWTALEALAELGAIPVMERVVIDRNRVTGAGVSAGIDLALQVATILESEECARELQLQIEYYPAPAFNCAGAHLAPTQLIEKVKRKKQALTEKRIATAKRVRAQDKGCLTSTD